ncbi:MAG TPA: protein translocase subunit SecD [Gemmatimonadaceae bacterium]|nr:protein translocase subunit SecD [Gemmatimonadaceae bacterium]
MKLSYRLALIAAIVAASIWALWPRTVTQRSRDTRTGSFRLDTIERVPLKRGLDLVGGMHLTLEVDESKQAVADKAEALSRALKVVRTRIDEFGVSEPVVQQVGSDRIIVELPGIDDAERAAQLVERSAFLEFQITDETNALDKALPRIDAALRQLGEGGATATSGASKTRDTTRVADPITGLFTPGDSAQTAAADSAAGDTSTLTAVTDGPFSRLIQPGQMPGEYFVERANLDRIRHYLDLPQVRAALPPGKVIRFGAEDESVRGEPLVPFYVLDTRPIITGEFLTDARPNTDPIEGNIVQFNLNNEGGRLFKRETGRHVGDYMAIVLDQRVMGRPPVIQSAIGTRGQITMRGQPVQAAQDLALVLRAGALPVPLKVIEARQIGASMGKDAVQQGLYAGLLGIVLVIVIMVVYYRFSGFLAVVGLMFYSLTTLAILAGFGAVLTLPGLAGFVLSIGMAVDANFLIFERIREELIAGKTVRHAIDEGFKHAWSAIVDTHVTTALTAAILYQFGTGPVQGFAVALLAGLAASLMSAIFVVRTLFMLWLQRARHAQTLSI